MHYSNHDNRQQRPEAAPSSPQKLLSLERNSRGLCLRVRTAATMARRKLVPFGLPVAAVLTLFACVVPFRVARAQLGYDPFAGNLVHNEEQWATYSNAALDGTNRPGTTFINGVNAAAANASSFNFAVTNINPSSGSTLFTGGTGNGNIYSFNAALTLTLTSNAAPTAGTFNTVVFSIKTLGTALYYTGVQLTLGTGMSATAQSAFQFDLSSFGGSNNFSIAASGSGSSVSFSSSQLDATTTVTGLKTWCRSRPRWRSL